MARRTSYASVLSGAASSNPQPARSGLLSRNAQPQHPLSGSGSYGNPLQPGIEGYGSPSQGIYGDAPRAYDGRQRSPDGFERDSLPSYPGKWSEGLGGTMAEPRQPIFFVPSYLRASRHLDRLEEKHRAWEQAHKEGRSPRSSLGGTISRSESGANLQKMVPSHRGMTYEIQEKFVPAPDEFLAPLPTRWSGHDKGPPLEVSADGVEVKCTGQPKTDDAATVRTDFPIPRACGIYYFEITIMGRTKDSAVGVGFTGQKSALNRQPGWEPETYAYHGDDGYKFGGSNNGTPYGPKFNNGDIIGCGIDFENTRIFFTKNGNFNGIAFRNIKGTSFFPAVGMSKQGAHIKVNLGQEPFAFDIDGFVETERDSLRAEIDAVDASVLHPDRASESQLMQELVGQYLAHEGYTETTRAFANEVKQSISYLKGPETAESSSIVYKEDPDAIKRQRIRFAVLEGRVQKAVNLTNDYYPSVLRDNENIYFKLRCREFIELMKKSTELQPRSKRPSTASSHRRPFSRHSKSMSISSTNGHHARHESYDSSAYMDVDPEDGEEGVAALPLEAQQQQKKLMDEALLYGRKLHQEFKDDPRREVKQALEDTFALIAYADARESSLAYLLEESHRMPVAEELNSAILISLGQSSTAALEKLVKQTETLLLDLGSEGGGAALLHLNKHFLR